MATDYERMTKEERKIIEELINTPLDNVFEAHHEAEVVLRGVTKKEYERMLRKIQKRGSAWMHDYEWAIVPDKYKRFFYRLDNLFIQLIGTFVVLHLLVYGSKFPGVAAWFSWWTINVGGMLAAIATMLAIYMEYVSYKASGVDEKSRAD